MRFVFQVARPGIGPATEWFFIHSGDATGRTRSGGMVLSCCRQRGTRAGKNAAAAIWQKSSPPEAASTQERLLKMKLKIHRRTLTARKDLLEMLNGLQERFGV